MPQRAIPSTVQLSPQFLEHLPSSPPDPAQPQAGLLFGDLADSHITLESFEPLDPLLWEQPALVSGPRPNLVGWYAYVSQNRLSEADYRRHNRYFRRASDVALLIQPGADSTVLAGLYARAESAPLAPDNCAFDTRLVSKSVKLLTFALPVRIGPELYLQPYDLPAEGSPARSRRWLFLALAILAGLAAGFVVGNDLHLSLP